MYRAAGRGIRSAPNASGCRTGGRIGVSAVLAALIVSLGTVLPDAAGAAQAPQPTPTPLPSAQLEAREARLRAGIQLNPGGATLHAQLGELLDSQGRFAEARDAFANAVRLEPMNPEYRGGLGRAHLGLQEYPEAASHFAWAAELAPQDARMFAGWGEALLAQGRVEEATTALKRAFELDPRNQDIRALLTRADPEMELPGQPGGALLRYVGRLLTYLAIAGLTVAGLGLALPVAAAIVVLIVFLPRSLLHRRKG